MKDKSHYIAALYNKIKTEMSCYFASNAKFNLENTGTYNSEKT